MTTNWKALQNGSDIRGIALEGVPGEEVTLSVSVVRILGEAFVYWLKQHTEGARIRLAIGNDSRLSAESLKQSFIAGATISGATVYDCGLSSTPAMFIVTMRNPAGVDGPPLTAGVMVTASHLPANRNGFKFFTAQGGLDRRDIAEILQYAQEIEDGRLTEPEIAGIQPQGPVIPLNYMAEYSELLVTHIRKEVNNGDTPLKGFKIIVDAGNGAGGFFVDKVLVPLGADVRGSLFLEPDGNFPNHVPNPEDKTAIGYLCEAVLREKAHLGIIFDTDVDRAAIVDEDGQPINRNSLIALISAIVLRKHPGSTVVTDSITSDGLTKFIEEDLGGHHHRFKRGYKNVINEAVRLNLQKQECWLAIETSGHAALKENYFLDDGAFLVAKLLIESALQRSKGRTLASLIERLLVPIESTEIRFVFPFENFAVRGLEKLDALNAILKDPERCPKGWEEVSPNYEGIRVRCTDPQEDGWFLLRLSLHEPILPLNIESNIPGGVQLIEKNLRKLLEP